MFTLGILYFVIYIFVIISLFCLSFIKFPVYCLTQWSLSTFFLFLTKYTKLKELYYFLFFFLTGLPPFGLFFIKFNILTFIFYQTHLFTMAAIFFLFFLNMIYYMQIFNIKNYKKNLYNVLNNDIFFLWNSNKKFIKIKETYNTFYTCLTIISFSGFFCFFLSFYSDFYLIFLI